MRISIYLLSLVSLLGCGVKGAIYFPEDPEQQTQTTVKETQPIKHKKQP